MGLFVLRNELQVGKIVFPEASVRKVLFLELLEGLLVKDILKVFKLSLS